MAQFTFNITTGVIGFNAASFGNKFSDKAIVFVGLQYIRATYNFEEPGFTDELIGNLIVPNLGIRYYIKRKENCGLPTAKSNQASYCREICD